MVAVFTFLKAYRIPSSAMEPTLRCARPVLGGSGSTSDRIAAIRSMAGIDPGRGDLVAFEAPEAATVMCGAGGIFVTRVIGLPGESIVTANGLVLVDGRPLREPYAASIGSDTRRTGPTTIPADNYFLMGDNRSLSCDSREYGPVPRDRLIAQVLFRYWPPGRIGTP